jgi:hypothetical protein
MNIYLEESGTPFAGISNEPKYFVITATRFSSTVDIKHILAASKEKNGFPSTAILHGPEIKRKPQLAENFFKEVFSYDWGDTEVVSVVLDKSQIQLNSTKYSEALGTVVSLALTRHRITGEVDLITDNPMLVREERTLKQYYPLLDEVFLAQGESPKFQVADLITYAIFRRFSHADNTLFQYVSHLIVQDTPTVSPTAAGTSTSLAPYQSQRLGERIVKLRYQVNESSKLRTGKNLFKPSSKSEYFSALIAGLKPFAHISELSQYVRDLHQYMFESSNGGKSLRPYISDSSNGILEELNFLRIYFSHDLEQDKDSPNIVQAKYQKVGEIFTRHLRIASPPNNINDFEKFRLSLLEDLEKVLVETLSKLQ